MKTSCSQCGAVLPVLRRDFYIRCPYCGASLLLDTGGLIMMLASPVVTADSLPRILPLMEPGNARLSFFPYIQKRDGLLEPCFAQPVSQLDGYRPPSSSVCVLSSGDAGPDQLMPPAEGASGTIVFHPFFQVTTTARGLPETVLVDAVTGLVVGSNGMDTPPAVPTPSRSFIEVLVLQALVAMAVFTLSRLAGADGQGGFTASAVACVVGCLLLIRFRILR